MNNLQKRINILNNIMIGILLFFVLFLILSLGGCSSTIENFRDNDFVQGCKVTEAEAKLGYFNQEGNAVVCKLKCSEKLPENLYYKYDNNRTGCHVLIGSHDVDR